MARGSAFDDQAPIFAEIAADPWLTDRILIAEPWDLGPGGYQLGRSPDKWLEWNDMFRDDVRRFWRGDGGIASLVTRLCGSSDVFGGHTRSVNFLAAHDGFSTGRTRSLTRPSTMKPMARAIATAITRIAAGTTASRGRATIRPVRARARRGSARAPCNAFRFDRHDHADRRRRVRPHPAARQQQCLCAGQ